MLDRLWRKQRPAPRYSREVVGPLPDVAPFVARSDELRSTSEKAQRSEADIERNITPEIQRTVKDIFIHMIQRSGIPIEQSNIEALRQPVLFTDDGTGDAFYDVDLNRLMYNVGDVYRIDKGMRDNAREEANARLHITPSDEEMLDEMEEMYVHIHEKVHMMGRIFIDYRDRVSSDSIAMMLLQVYKPWKHFQSRLVEEVGISRVVEDGVLSDFRVERKFNVANEGLVDIFTFLMMDELNRRLGLGLNIDLFDAGYYAPELSKFTYPSYQFIVLAMVKRISMAEHQPIEVIFNAFARAHFYGDDFYQRECKQMIDAVFGTGFYDELSKLKETRDEKGNRVVDGQTLPFIKNWELGTPDKDGPAILRELRDARIFAAAVSSSDSVHV